MHEEAGCSSSMFVVICYKLECFIQIVFDGSLES